MDQGQMMMMTKKKKRIAATPPPLPLCRSHNRDVRSKCKYILLMMMKAAMEECAHVGQQELPINGFVH